VENIYKILFTVGLAYTAITTILGAAFDVFDIGGDIDLDGDLPLLNIFKPINIVSFITVFGGVGLIGIKNELNQAINFCIALGSGLIVSFLINRFIVIPLQKAENTSAPTNEDLIGLKATVITTIFENGFGTISYSFKGNKYTSPAKHLEGKEVKKGEKVRIWEIRDKVFYVLTLNETSEIKKFLNMK